MGNWFIIKKLRVKQSSVVQDVSPPLFEGRVHADDASLGDLAVHCGDGDTLSVRMVDHQFTVPEAGAACKFSGVTTTFTISDAKYCASE
jgi:hypothetical protein